MGKVSTLTFTEIILQTKINMFRQNQWIFVAVEKAKFSRKYSVELYWLPNTCLCGEWVLPIVVQGSAARKICQLDCNKYLQNSSAKRTPKKIFSQAENCLIEEWQHSWTKNHSGHTLHKFRAGLKNQPSHTPNPMSSLEEQQNSSKYLESWSKFSP